MGDILYEMRVYSDGHLMYTQIITKLCRVTNIVMYQPIAMAPQRMKILLLAKKPQGGRVSKEATLKLNLKALVDFKRQQW